MIIKPTNASANVAVKTNAIKETSMNAKNIDMSPRTANAPTIDAGGMKFKVVGGDDSSSLKFKIRNK